MILLVANPDLELRGGGRIGLALPAFLPSAIFPFLLKISGGDPPVPSPSSATGHYDIK